MFLLDGVGKSGRKRVKETRGCRPVVGVIILIMQRHKALGMFSNSIKRETCVLLKNADHVLWILRMRHVGNGVQACILELLQEGSLEDRQITAAVK
jgi:hypothetical protein